MEELIPSKPIDQFKEQLKKGSVYTLERFITDARKK
jgi:hypothetical protein